MKLSALRGRRAWYPVLAVALAACPPTMPPMAEVTILGTVRHPDGSPAAGAHVTISETIMGCDKPARAESVVTTNVDGRFGSLNQIRVGGDSRCFAFVAAVPGAGLRSDTLRITVPPARSEDDRVQVNPELTLRPAE